MRASDLADGDVVITGRGVVSPIGNSVAETEPALREGRSGLDVDPDFARLGMRCHVGGRVKGLEPVNFETILTLEELSPARTRVTLHSIFPSAKASDFVVREYGAIEGGKQHLARMAEHAAALASRSGGPRELVIHRVVDAPRALVYAAWTGVEHLAQWFGPKGCTLRGCELDLRPGGTFLHGMHSPDAQDCWGKWVFR